MTITIKQCESDDADHMAAIIAALNRRFAAVKRANPRGYQDAFEQRLSLTLTEVADELGAQVTFNEYDDALFDFTHRRMRCNWLA